MEFKQAIKMYLDVNAMKDACAKPRSVQQVNQVSQTHREAG